MNNIIGMRTFKTALGATISILIAQTLGLNYALSAGIITILSIQNTKLKSLQQTKNRIFSTLLALTLASFIFLVLGFNAFSFGIYLLLFIPFTVRLSITDGIVVSSVLVTHLLGEQVISISLLLNECMLMIIGAGIGIILNIYMPNMQEAIKRDQAEIEKQIKVILLYLAKTIRTQSVYVDEEEVYQVLQHKLEQAKQKAYQNVENYMTSDRSYYVHYMEMRTLQFQILQQMRVLLGNVHLLTIQNSLLANLTERVANALHENNDVIDLLNETKQLLELIRQQPLPVTRDQFESRAMLFQYLNELIQLLEIKRSFRESLTTEQLESFGCTTV